jgi:hypothetical protein
VEIPSLTVEARHQLVLPDATWFAMATLLNIVEALTG